MSAGSCRAAAGSFRTTAAGAKSGCLWPNWNWHTADSQGVALSMLPVPMGQKCRTLLGVRYLAFSGVVFITRKESTKQNWEPFYNP